MNQIQKLRIKKDLTRKELGVSPKTIQSWETIARSPKPPMMQHIEDFFGVPKEEIFAAFSYKS